MIAANDANEIRITRVYDAPVARVWEAWTELEQVAQWWGPRGFTITTVSKDLRPGGSWEYTMHGPDGTDYPNFTRYHEVVPHRRLVYDHGASSADARPMFRVTVDFRDLTERTEMVMAMRMETPEEVAKARAIIKTASGNTTWDRLAEHLEKAVAGKEIFIINRSFPAPIETMLDLWTDPAHVAKWSAPTGFTMEIRRPDLVQYIQCFADEHENISRHPGAPVWPEKMLTTIVLTPEGADQTRVTIRWEVYGTSTAEELAAFVAERSGMTKGWTGSLDKLEEFISSSTGSHAS